MLGEVEMEDAWYYVDTNRTPVGPSPCQSLEALRANGRITSDTLVWTDGMKEWSRYSESGLKSPPPPPVPPPDQPIDDDGWQCTKPRPWRRYFARLLDTVVIGSLLGFAFGMLTLTISGDLYQAVYGHNGLATNDFLASMITFVLVAPAGALMLGLTGTTLGKWLFGVRITDSEGRAIGFWQAGKREIQVFYRGLGLGIPIVYVITMIVAYRRLNKDGATTWDRSQPWVVTYRPLGAAQAVLASLGVIVILVTLLFLIMLEA